MQTHIEPGVRSAPDQLQRILSSRTFRNTEVLKRLLEYLGRKALAGEGHELKEYIVGVEAFGKPENYDPKVDSVVRVQAGKLRFKLEEYYRTEGAEDDVLIDLPKGCFALRFRDSDPVEALAPAPKPVSEIVPVAPRFSLPWLIAGFAMLACAVSSYYAFVRPRPPAIPARYTHPAVAELWQPFVSGPRPVAVSLGAPLFARIGGRFVRNTKLNEWSTLDSAGEVKWYEEVLGGGKAFPSYIYTGIGEAAGVFELGRLFLALGHEADLVPSNVLSWETIERSNVIFVGPPKYNRQAEHLPAAQEFTIESGRIVNIHPRKGEPPFYGQVYSADRIVSEGHALIARLPGLHDTGWMMLLASTSTEGSRAAVDYVTRPEYVTKLLASLRDKQGNIPRYFECVVRARFKSQTPIQIDQVALRTR